MKVNTGRNSPRPSGIFKKALLAGLLICAPMIAPTIAHADSYINYDVNGTFNSGGSLSGTFTIDTTTSTISAANMLADGVTFTCPDPGGLSNGCTLSTTLDHLGDQAGFQTGADASQFLLLDWANGSNSGGFSLDTYVAGLTEGSYCIGCAPGVSADLLASGTAIDPAPDTNGDPTATPEPGTWLLLLSGLAGLGFLGLRHHGIVTSFAS